MAETMTLREICAHERLGMLTRHWNGYDQHDDHVWRWLNHHLREWSAARPIRITDDGYHQQPGL